MAEQLFDMEIPIRSTGSGAVKAEWRQLETAATGTTQRAEQAVSRMANTVQRSMSRATAPLDAIRSRTDLLTEGLRRASTASASLTKLTAAERQLQAALQRGNLTLEQRIRLERELVRTQAALATVRTPAAVAPAGLGGRAGAAIGGLAASTRTALAGFAGGVAGGLVVGVAANMLSEVTHALSGMGEASDELETALRKLKATSRLTGVDLRLLEEQALKARDAFALSETQAVDLTAATIRLTQRAGDTAQAGALMTAWLDLAAANGQDANEALQGLNTTLIGQDEGLNRLGLSNPQQIYEKWAKAAGTTAAKMNDTQKAMAIVNEVVTVGASVSGEYANSLDTAAGAQVRAANEARALKAELGGLFSEIRKNNAAAKADFLTDVREAFAFLREGADFWKLAFEQGPFDAFRQRQLQAMVAGAQGGSSSTAASQPGETPEDLDKRVALLVRSLALGTADNALRREAAQLARTYATASRDESLALDVRNQHAERAKALTEALATATKGGTAAVEDLASATRQRTAALLALGELEGPNAERWKELTARAGALTAALTAGTLAVEDRVAALRELAAIQAQVDPALPLDRMTPQRGLDIRRDTVDLAPMAPQALPGGEGSVFSRMVDQLVAEGASVEDAIRTVQARISAAAQDMAAGITAALVGAFSGQTDFGAAIVGALGQMAIQFGIAVMGIGALMEKALLALSSLNPIAAIAAGAALVAIGAMLSSAASKSFGGGGGRGVARATVPVGRTVTVPIGSSGSTVAAAASTGGPATPVVVQYLGDKSPGFERWLGNAVTRVQKRGL